MVINAMITYELKRQQVIAKRKEDYHNIIASKLNNPKTSAKAYWSILKTFYNGKKNSSYSSSFDK